MEFNIGDIVRYISSDTNYLVNSHIHIGDLARIVKIEHDGIFVRPLDSDEDPFDGIRGWLFHPSEWELASREKSFFD